VWVKHGNFVYPVEVQIGITDRSSTEIIAGDLSEGMKIVLTENPGDAPVEEGTNPFAFRRPGPTKKEKKDK
jgi:HlyD family secretion protein